jgi:hypothetical protein
MGDGIVVHQPGATYEAVAQPGEPSGLRGQGLHVLADRLDEQKL